MAPAGRVPTRPPFFKEATLFSPSAVGLEEYGEAHVATIQIYDLASRVHEPEGQRLEIGPTADNVVLLVLGHVEDLTAEAMALRVYLFANRMFSSGPQRAPEAGELRARDIQGYLSFELQIARRPHAV